MVWSTPKTWAAAELVDEAEMNTHLRDNLNYLNDLRIKYAQRSTNFGGITSSQSTVLTAPAFTPISASRIIKITARWRSIVSTVANDIFSLRINEVSVGQINEVNVGDTSGSGKGGGTNICYVPSPSATSHTYALAADRVAGSGTGTIEAAATYPIQIIVEDIGAA